MIEVYENTRLNSIRVGWVLMPEFCAGDRRNSTHVVHDRKLGVFFFTNDPASYRYALSLAHAEPNPDPSVERIANVS